MRSPGHRRHRAHNQMQMDYNSNRYSHSLRTQKRSLSPHRMDGSHLVERLDERSDFVGRREYCRDVGLFCHDDAPYEQKSPSYGRMTAKRSHLDLEVDNTNFRYPIKYEQESLEPGDNNIVEGKSSSHKNFYRNELNNSRLAYRDSYMGESCQPYQNVPSTSHYGNTRIQVPTSRNVDMELSEYKRIRCPGKVASESPTFVETHADKEHLAFDSSEGLHHRVTGSDYREIRNSNGITDLGRSSSNSAGYKGLGSYQAKEMIASSHEFSRRSDEYEPRPVDSDERIRSANYHQRGVGSPRNEHEDYLYSKLRGSTNHAHEYARGSFNKRTHLHTEMGYGLEHSEGDYWDPIIMDTTLERQKDIAESYASLGRGGMIEGHPTCTRNSILDYRDSGRTRISIKRDGRFIDAPDDHVEVVGRVPQDYRMSNFDDCQYSNVSREYDYGRKEKLKFHEELSSHPVSMPEPNHRYMDWLQTRDGYDSYKQEVMDSLLGSKYTQEKEVRATNYRINMSGEYEASRKYHDLYSNNEDVLALDLTRETRFTNEKSRNTKRTYDQHKSVQSDDLLSSQEYYRRQQTESSETHKNQTRFMDGNPRHGSLSGNSPRHFERRNRHDKTHIVWKRIEYCHDDVQENNHDDDQVEEMKGPVDPPENSEEFMQLVLDGFLKYSKHLNLKASIRKRYKGQGKSGTLYCIVCGSSLSKEFMDTQSLLRHAFMSRKAGLRAQHLGLLKAVCVMLGWNSAVPRNVVTWSPEVLSSAEALAQKEDLIIWPPIVVVRNISLLDHTRHNWRLVTTEALEALLRSKGLIGGSVKACVGRPGDQSVVVVKFSGTFSGLGDAERIHRYFEQNKRGRVEFEKITSRRKNSSGYAVANDEGEKREEQVLFGSMGIAEDLDEVDANTKKWSVIKSKREIHEWANAPIIPDERESQSPAKA